MIYDKNRPGRLGQAIDHFDTPETDFLDRETGNYLRGLSINTEKALHRGKKVLALAGVIVASAVGFNELNSAMIAKSTHEPGQTYLKYQQEQHQEAQNQIRIEDASRPPEEHVAVTVTNNPTVK